RTSTGRVEFYVEKLKSFGQELPVYIEPKESSRSEKAKKYPLSLLSTHPENRIHSTLGIIPDLLKSDPEPTLAINPEDAEQRNIADGDVVRVFNDRGRMKVKAKLSKKIKAGIVNTTEGWWPEQFIEGHLNELTHDMINPAQEQLYQANAAFCDVLVEVEKV
ncbi:molybdopterin dinucleotide binding domain-containing protein, partial [Thermodesulfobacteriota bacterium]